MLLITKQKQNVVLLEDVGAVRSDSHALLDEDVQAPQSFLPFPVDTKRRCYVLKNVYDGVHMYLGSQLENYATKRSMHCTVIERGMPMYRNHTES